MAVPETVQRIWKAMIETNKFDKVLEKVKLISAGQGQCTAEMTVSEEHCNISGTLHGGLTCTLVDVLSGVALVTDKNYPSKGVSVDLHVTFLSAAPVGEQIVIESRTNKVGRTLAFLEVNIKNKKTDKIVAKGSHTKFVAT
ncbi:acyl-coenzyme A thioesterase 13-like [Rhodnius prolixus]|uniref:acyl-coenzyme A thioesterase 13-like n=1 Tax=Rhodnius prolixus TaxID=13249 RepID=UPI003D189F33